MFAISEILRYVTAIARPVEVPHQAIGNVFRGLGRVLWRYWTQPDARQPDRRRASASCRVPAPTSRPGSPMPWPSASPRSRRSSAPATSRARRRRRRQQLGARRRLGPGAGVRHSRRFDHRDRDRRALHEGHEPRPDDHAARARAALRRLHHLHPRQHHDAAARLRRDPPVAPDPARAARRPDAASS